MSKLVKALPFVIIFSLLMASTAYAGIGLSPASIEFHEMTRGGYAEKYLTVSNPGLEDVSVVVSASGQEIEEFLTFSPQRFNLTGGSYRIVKVNATPPIDIPNGIYEGTVFVVGKPIVEQGEGTRLVVASGVSAITKIEVTDVETKKYKVEGALVYDTEECREIQVQTSIRNTGNVRVSPQMNVKIISKDMSLVLQDYDYTGEVMLPTTLKSHMIRVPYTLEQFRCIPVGDYNVKITYYIDGAEQEFRYLPLRIHERGELTVSGELIEFNTSSNITLGDTLRIDGLFKNKGQLPVKSKLTVEVYDGTKLVDTVSSDEKEVGIGEISRLIAYYEPSSAGKFLLKGGVWFEGKTSNIREAEVEVLFPMIYMIAIATGAILAVIIAIIFLRKRAGPKKGRRRR